jgi:hypothetical protein
VAVAHGLVAPRAPSLTLAAVLRAHLERPRAPGMGEGTDADYRRLAAAMEPFMQHRDVRCVLSCFACTPPPGCTPRPVESSHVNWPAPPICLAWPGLVYRRAVV